MSVKTTVERQLRKQVEQAAERPAHALRMPSGGWIAAMRGALGMSGAQLGKRLGLSRSRISQAEKAERHGGVTLRTMSEMAEAMGARFVYAILPDGEVNDLIRAQARRKARAIVSEASTHMALEKQALSGARLEEEIERVAEELMIRPPRDFWSDE